ncbi:MAG TPA: type II secretion system protein GspG, partial [Candidatus Omnitrophota bacterium]|nr:type II secretion system protein GspG [Candidatus Omnitrophota bacterium]
PTTAQGLQSLRVKPSVSPIPVNWNGPYLPKDPVDPWGNPYVYVSPGRNNPDYDIFSKGKDVNASEDDIKNW